MNDLLFLLGYVVIVGLSVLILLELDRKGM